MPAACRPRAGRRRAQGQGRTGVEACACSVPRRPPTGRPEALTLAARRPIPRWLPMKSPPRFAIVALLVACSTSIPTRPARGQTAPTAAAAPARQTPPPTPDTSGGRLPVRRVVLYKSGVGYFEHVGRVRDDQTMAIDLTSGQLDDVLKSLTTVDLGEGRVTGITFNSDRAVRAAPPCDAACRSGKSSTRAELLGRRCAARASKCSRRARLASSAASSTSKSGPGAAATRRCRWTISAS